MSKAREQSETTEDAMHDGIKQEGNLVVSLKSERGVKGNPLPYRIVTTLTKAEKNVIGLREQCRFRTMKLIS